VIAKGNSQSVREDKDSSLSKLTKLCKQNPNIVFDKFVNFYANSDTLTYAYKKIKSKAGNMTPGVTKETLDSIDMNWFQHMEKELLQGTYRFKNIRRIYIDKPNSKDKQPLRISFARDKIVQRA
jgi:retron-type reverse transcriptase